MAGPRYYLSQFVTFLFYAQSIGLQINWVLEHKKGANFGSGRLGFAALGTHCTTGDWYLPKHQVTQNNKLYPNNNPCTNNLDTFWEPSKNSGSPTTDQIMLKICGFLQKVDAGVLQVSWKCVDLCRKSRQRVILTRPSLNPETSVTLHPLITSKDFCRPMIFVNFSKHLDLHSFITPIIFVVKAAPQNSEPIH